MKIKLSILAVLILNGCSASGPAFKPIIPLPSDKGVVYIYREHSIFGSAVYGTVTANNAPITKINNGGYFPYITDANNVHFEVSTEATNEADLIIEKGKEKYLKTTIGMGFLVGHLKFTEVTPETGQKEISECNLLEPY